MLALDPQRFAACCQDVDLRSLLEDVLRQCRRSLHHMLAAVEDQQHPPVSQEADQARGRITGLHQEAERRRDRARHEARIAERPEIKKSDRTLEGGKLREIGRAHV